MFRKSLSGTISGTELYSRVAVLCFHSLFTSFLYVECWGVWGEVTECFKGG